MQPYNIPYSPRAQLICSLHAVPLVTGHEPITRRAQQDAIGGVDRAHVHHVAGSPTADTDVVDLGNQYLPTSLSVGVALYISLRTIVEISPIGH